MTVVRSASKTGDRRANRTRQSLRNALVQLILEKRYDGITVQNIIDRANVGRSTFYAHYKDKEELFQENIEELFNSFVQRIEWRNIGHGHCLPIRELFSHIQEFHRFQRALAKSRKMTWFYKTALGHLTQSIEDKLTSLLAHKSESSVPIPVV